MRKKVELLSTNKTFVGIYKGLISIIMLLIFFGGLFMNFIVNSYQAAVFFQEICAVSAMQSNNQSGDLKHLRNIFKDFFYQGGKLSEKKEREIYVYPGGFPLGFSMECEGVIIISLGAVQTEKKVEKPWLNKNIKIGDVLYSVNGEVIKNSNHLHQLLNKNNSNDKVEIVLYRGKEIITETIIPALEHSSQMLRLGFWIRDNAAGVGTLTFVREDNNRFGALGHPVCDIDTGKLVPLSGGNIYKCSIVGYNKGVRGTPGELRGLFLKNGLIAGSLDKNKDCGVYGEMSKEYVENMNVKPIKVGFRDSVKTGKAQILTTIEGGKPERYDIEIVNLSYQNKSNNKSMVIKVTDQRLIDSTGGILQGMSGSPIIQNNKLVGAVTHVFVGDPTKGFGIYIDWMIDN